MKDHAADEELTAQYPDSWRTRQRLVAAFFGLFISLPLLTALVAAVIRSDTLVATLFVTCGVGIVVTGIWLWAWPCPRCSFPFHQGRLGWLGPWSPLRVRCLHCGLARQVYTEHGRSLVRGELDELGEGPGRPGH